MLDGRSAGMPTTRKDRRNSAQPFATSSVAGLVLDMNQLKRHLLSATRRTTKFQSYAVNAAVLPGLFNHSMDQAQRHALPR